MHPLSRRFFCLTLFTLLLSASHGALAAVVDDGPIPDQYIVTLKQGHNPPAVASDMARTHAFAVRHVYQHALRGFAATIPAARLQQLREDPRVENVVQDYFVHASARPGGGGTQPAEVLPTGIRRINGPGTTPAGVIAAVIDTGIYKHADLYVIGGVNCSTGKIGSYSDGNGHGTHVAGTIGAKDNEIGVVGVAPGIPLLAVRVLDNSGSGSWSSVACGIDWVTGQAKTRSERIVANMSLGGSGPANSDCNDGGLHEAICNSVNAGVTYAVAAGNAHIDVNSSSYAGYEQVPAAYPEVITVSALADFDGQPGGDAASTCRSDVDDSFADFSNYGAAVDIIAPGVCILSTWKDGGYNTISGTSMATPHVTGAAALYVASHPGATPAEVRTGLLAAGNNVWSNDDDPDGIQEPLLDVSGP